MDNADKGWRDNNDHDDMHISPLERAAALVDSLRKGARVGETWRQNLPSAPEQPSPWGGLKLTGREVCRESFLGYLQG